jgi:hypothetical protein
MAATRFQLLGLRFNTMRYLISNLIAFLFIAGVSAAESFVYTGIVKAQSANASTILINTHQYSVNSDTVVHGLPMQGELGPMINLGQKIGYNVEQHNDELPYISEIWFLN